jgi:DNA-binding transcriptional MerR regulator/methylmalonyl-CoA mutase cobalamin-binding subunit
VAKYQIKTVSELFGIPKNTLVAWERRYDVVKPSRLDNGYRVYSEADLDVIRRLKGALDRGMRIGEAVRNLSADPQAVSLAPDDLADRPTPEGDDPFMRLREKLEQALMNFDQARAKALNMRLMAVPISAVIEQVFFPMLRSVGDRWRAGEVTVAQEHFASAFVKQQLSGMLMASGGGSSDAPMVACTTMPSDIHEIGALALAVRLAEQGYKVTYLGADTPVDALGLFAAGEKPRWLCVSSIMPVDLQTVATFACVLRLAAPPETGLVIGGAGLPDLDALSVEGVLFMRDWGSWPPLGAAP